ncbi:hypothetical protein TPA0910_84520 [Streptomyces hygroscopicus subsp. sporocinereus]|uniref:Uncharacterized protein n=1 Tax=Streptomyces hygroscopicus TaxID=1912 RepID=A0ABQ3UEL8_STRHY|nr:hypothetical protein TPA0910_84520 [Streptomyces hygroscopicus]
MSQTRKRAPGGTALPAVVKAGTADMAGERPNPPAHHRAPQRAPAPPHPRSGRLSAPRDRPRADPEPDAREARDALVGSPRRGTGSAAPARGTSPRPHAPAPVHRRKSGRGPRSCDGHDPVPAGPGAGRSGSGRGPGTVPAARAGKRGPGAGPNP